MDDEALLVCPRCATMHGLDERFCPDCGMPLTYQGPVRDEATERHARARKIKPQYTEGDLVVVARGRNQAEADFISNLLLEEGVPSLVRRSRGFDVPDMLAAGPRDVLVPRSGELTAREVLLQSELHDGPGAAPSPRPAALLAGLLGVVALVGLIVWVGSLASG
ncbi:MAG TPA: hypothetical protein VMT10_01155 [Solirubrobacteraceae bacterium]|nr:hypothetical protein [Solirubrobacteraceae bacterium]